MSKNKTSAQNLVTERVLEELKERYTFDGTNIYVIFNRANRRLPYPKKIKGERLWLDGRRHRGSHFVLALNGIFLESHQEVVYKDKDRENLRLENLLVGDRSAAAWTEKLSNNNTSGVKGLCYRPKIKQWQGSVRKGRSREYKLFKSRTACILWLMDARIRLHGKFATN